MIRALQSHEVPVMLEAGNAFYKEGKFPGAFCNATFTRRMTGLIDRDPGSIIASFTPDNEFQGALAAAVCECPFTGDEVAVEMFWFILPRFRGGIAGVRLLLAFDDWARQRGVKRAAMIHLETETNGVEKAKLSALYERMGFFPVEINYIKSYEAVEEKGLK